MSAARQPLRVNLPGVPLEIQVLPAEMDQVDPARGGERIERLRADPDGVRRYLVNVDGWSLHVEVQPARRAELRERAARAAAEHQVHDRLTLRAQIPGRVVRVWAEAGQQVAQGERLLAVEAMKMENEVRSPRAGVVATLHVELGERVERDAELLTLD